MSIWFQFALLLLLEYRQFANYKEALTGRKEKTALLLENVDLFRKLKNAENRAAFIFPSLLIW